MKQLLVLLISTLSLSVFANTDYPKPQTPQALHQLFGQYFAKEDLDGLGSLFHEDAVFILDAEGNQARGKEAIKAVLKTFMQGDVEMITHSVSIHVNQDVALIRSEWEIPNAVSGTALEVMHYVNGGWLYVIDNPNGY